MKYKYLLDTNILSDLMKHPSGIVYKKILEVGEEKICTSIIVACELRFGIEKSGSVRLAESLDKILSAINILPLEIPTEHYYAKIRNYLEQSGTPIGPNDLLIASQALTLDLIVVSANKSEFSRVKDLQVENWLENE